MSNITELKAQLAAIEAEWHSKINAAKNMRSLDALVNEGAEGYSIVEETQETLAEQCLPKVNAIKDAVFAAEWTIEATNARRAAWNAEMQALVAAKLPANAKTIPPIVKRLGYGPADIQRAKTLHGIA